MDSQPEQRPIKLTKRSPEEALFFQTQKLLQARNRLRALEYGRWAMFSEHDLRYIQKGLEAVILQLATGSSIENLTEAQELLNGLNAFLSNHPPTMEILRAAGYQDIRQPQSGP